MACLRSFCRSFRNPIIRKGDLCRTIFGLKKPFLAPRHPEGFSLDEFKIFYSFPAIRIVSVISSAKRLKAAVCVACGCVSVVAYNTGLISDELCLIVVVTGIYCTLGVFGTAYFSRNLIGKMYTNKSRSEIVISSVNGDGQRINKTFKSDEVKMSDHPHPIGKKFFKQISCSGENVKYNLYCHRGMKMDFFSFAKIFPNFK